MMVRLDICRDTFYRWINDYPLFGTAYERSKIVSQAFYEKLLLDGALGKIERFNFNSVAMILNNKCPQEYKRSATGSNTEINYIGNVNAIKNLDMDSLDQKIKQLNQLNNITIEKDTIAIDDNEQASEDRAC